MFNSPTAIQERRDAEKIPGTPKMFKVMKTEGKGGRGQQVLRTPGLEKVYAVFVGDRRVDEYSDRTIPSGFRKGVAQISDDEFKNKIRLEYPSYKIDNDVDKTPCLLRAEHSNDGYWQEDVDITIYGEWNESKAVSGKN